MNYIWEYFIRANKAGVKPEQITFKRATCYSAYLELALDALNINCEKDGITEIEINPYYRFYSIFKNLFDVNDTSQDELKEILFDWFVQFIVRTDLKKDFGKQEFYRIFMERDIKNGCFGKKCARQYEVFEKNKKTFLLNQLVLLYTTGEEFEYLESAVHGCFSHSYVYRNQKKKEILIYLGVYKSETAMDEIEFIMTLFSPLGYEIRLYWDQHFGIMGQSETMKMNEIILY